jgi:hypothetical protein
MSFKTVALMDSYCSANRMKEAKCGDRSPSNPLLLLEG